MTDNAYKKDIEPHKTIPENSKNDTRDTIKKKNTAAEQEDTTGGVADDVTGEKDSEVDEDTAEDEEFVDCEEEVDEDAEEDGDAAHDQIADLTCVHKLGLAKSIHHARFLIRQRHIRVGKQIVNVASFIVRLDSQKHIDFAYNSPFGSGCPGRVRRKKAEAAADGDEGEEEEEEAEEKRPTTTARTDVSIILGNYPIPSIHIQGLLENDQGAIRTFALSVPMSTKRFAYSHQKPQLQA
ncbi:hypothetical protein MY4824_008144 [Beauveria thailandica]